MKNKNFTRLLILLFVLLNLMFINDYFNLKNNNLHIKEAVANDDAIFIGSLNPSFSVNNVCYGKGAEFYSEINELDSNFKFHWNFGDGNFSTELNPVHEYSTPGYYQVVFTISDGINSESFTRNVEVYSKPIADFKASPLIGHSPLLVQFQDDSISADGVINNWNWNFGDGSFNIPGKKYWKTYEKPGTYDVILTVIDINGCTDTIIKKNLILASLKNSCLSNSDCDDGLKCNGSEICQNGFCTEGVPIDCSYNNTIKIAECNIFDNPYIWDYREKFTSKCLEPYGICSFNSEDISHTCSVDFCSAECDDNHACADTNCQSLNHCEGDDYYIYNDVPNTCKGDCMCTANECEISEIIENSALCARCVINENCHDLNKTVCEGSEVIQYEGFCVENFCQAEIIDSQDCNDGLFCNGQETCSQGKCIPGKNIDCSHNNNSGIDQCGYDIDFPYRHYYRQAFVSSCNEEKNVCLKNTNSFMYDCDSQCGGCRNDADCDDDLDSTIDYCDSISCTCSHIDNIICGDGICNNREDCKTCERDCGSCIIDSVCGNSVQEAGEDCDDGNNIDGDGCSSCVFDTRTVYCENESIPLNSLWKTENYYLQTCLTPGSPNCLLWSDEYDSVYYNNETQNPCQFECSSAYVWDGQQCNSVGGGGQVCGNGIIEGEEECDGQTGIFEDNQICSSTCNFLTLAFCDDGKCDDNENCSTCPSDCGTCSNDDNNSGGSSGNGDNGGNNVSAGSGESSIFLKNKIINSQITMECSDAKVNLTMTWLTDEKTKSRVVYDTVSHDPVDISTTNYGYQYSTIEDPQDLTGHSVNISGLEDETVYYFRAISKGLSSEIVGEEKVLTKTLSCKNDDQTDVLVLGEEGSPELKISKTVFSSYVRPGDKGIEYNITIVNEGDLNSFNTIVTDVLPDGLYFEDYASSTRNWILGDIMSGEARVINYKVDVAKNASAKFYTNFASVVSDNHEAIFDSVDIEVGENSILTNTLAETGFDNREFTIVCLGLLIMVGFSLYYKIKLYENK